MDGISRQYCELDVLGNNKGEASNSKVMRHSGLSSSDINWAQSL